MALRTHVPRESVTACERARSGGGRRRLRSQRRAHTLSRACARRTRIDCRVLAHACRARRKGTARRALRAAAAVERRGVRAVARPVVGLRWAVDLARARSASERSRRRRQVRLHRARRQAPRRSGRLGAVRGRGHVLPLRKRRYALAKRAGERQWREGWRPAGVLGTPLARPARRASRPRHAGPGRGCRRMAAFEM